MNSTPKVSVIIPVYNVEEYVGCCVRSVFMQDWKNIEFIFVDDASTDRSVSIIEEILNLEFPELRPCVKIIRKEHSGLPQSRMAGLRVAEGEYIIHVDSDDWVEPEYISHLASKAVKENADVVYCDFIKEMEGRSKLVVEGEFIPSNGAMAVKNMHNSIIRGYMWNKLTRRSLYDLDKMFVPIYGYHEDLVFQTQILYRAAKVVHLNEALYHYRRKRKGALTTLPLVKSRKMSAENMLKLYDILPAEGEPKESSGIDILIRGGWYCACILNLKMLREHPEAVRILSSMKLIRDCRVPLFKQRFTRFICRLVLKRLK